MSIFNCLVVKIMKIDVTGELSRWSLFATSKKYVQLAPIWP